MLAVEVAQVHNGQEESSHREEVKVKRYGVAENGEEYRHRGDEQVDCMSDLLKIDRELRHMLELLCVWVIERALRRAEGDESHVNLTATPISIGTRRTYQLRRRSCILMINR